MRRRKFALITVAAMMITVSPANNLISYAEELPAKVSLMELSGSEETVLEIGVPDEAGSDLEVTVLDELTEDGTISDGEPEETVGMDTSTESIAVADAIVGDGEILIEDVTEIDTLEEQSTLNELQDGVLATQADTSSGLKINSVSGEWNEYYGEYIIKTTPGQDVTLTIDATSESGTVTYFWYGTYEISGERGSSVVLKNVAEPGSVSCGVGDGYQEEYVHFTIVFDTGFKASAEATEIEVENGSDATLHVNASTGEAYGPVMYVWDEFRYEDSTEGDGYYGLDVDGPSLVVKNVTKLQIYRCGVYDEWNGTDFYFTVAPREELDSLANSFERAQTLTEGTVQNAVIKVPKSKMYFKFIPKRSGVYSIVSFAENFPTGYLYDAERTLLTEDSGGYDENGSGDGNFELRYELEAGKTYYVVAWFGGGRAVGEIPVLATYQSSEEPVVHQWDEGIITEAPTCARTGVKTYTCLLHGETYTQRISKTWMHTMATVTDKVATCGATGSQHRECTVCGYQEEATTIPATGAHTMTTVTDRAASCGVTGSQHRACTVCGYQEAATAIPATGQHMFGGWATVQGATVLAEGMSARSCTVCGAQETSRIAKLTPTITLNATSFPLKVKQSTTKLMVSGLAAGDSVVSWRSSNEKIVKVDGNGKITAQKKTGKAVITITLASGLQANVQVKVQKGVVKTSKITNIVKKMTLKKGETAKLEPIITPITTKDKISYKSSNKKVAVVSKKGVITAKGAGKAKITVKSGSKKVVVTVTVPKMAPTDITGVKDAITLKKGKSTTLKPKLAPKGAEAKIKYKSSNKKIVTVTAKGKVTAKKKGTAVITITAGGIQKTCTVTVP